MIEIPPLSCASERGSARSWLCRELLFLADAGQHFVSCTDTEIEPTVMKLNVTVYGIFHPSSRVTSVLNSVLWQLETTLKLHQERVELFHFSFVAEETERLGCCARLHPGARPPPQDSQWITGHHLMSAIRAINVTSKSLPLSQTKF